MSLQHLLHVNNWSGRLEAGCIVSKKKW